MLFFRNVTKILCASLKQKNLRNYPNGLSGVVSNSSSLMIPGTSGSFADCKATDSTPIGVLLGRKHICNACNKAFTSLRNLQRHRSTCKSIYFASNPSDSKCTNVTTVSTAPPSSSSSSSSSSSQPTAIVTVQQPSKVFYYQ